MMIMFYSFCVIESSTRSVRPGVVTFADEAWLDFSVTENAVLDGIQYHGQSFANVTQGLRKARESCFIPNGDNDKFALLVTPGILSGDIRREQSYAIQVFVYLFLLKYFENLLVASLTMCDQHRS